MSELLRTSVLCCDLQHGTGSRPSLVFDVFVDAPQLHGLLARGTREQRLCIILLNSLRCMKGAVCCVTLWMDRVMMCVYIYMHIYYISYISAGSDE